MSERPSPSPAADWPFVTAGALLIGSALIVNEWVLGAWLTVGGVTNPASRLVLATMDVVALAAGFSLVRKGRQAPWRQMILALSVTVLTLTLAEAGLRVLFSVRSWAGPPERQLDDRLGWRPVANVSIDRELPGFGRVHHTTTRGGFRVFGDPASTRLKLFVLGDSYTEAATVSDGDTYYERLRRMRSDVEVFAIGGGGFGTLQQYLLLDEWVDQIRPGLVLLQMHPNDLINNSHALESRSTTDNNQMTRPYWEGGRATMRFPENASWGPLYNLVRHSYLLRLVNVNVTFLRSRQPASVERTATRDDSDVIEATRTTVELLTMMKRRAGVPVAVFVAETERATGLWSVREVCERAGVLFIPGVAEAVDAAAAAGERVSGHPIDAHWNGRGHEIAAGVIDAWLARGEWRGR